MTGRDYSSNARGADIYKLHALISRLQICCCLLQYITTAHYYRYIYICCGNTRRYNIRPIMVTHYWHSLLLIMLAHAIAIG